MPRFISTMRIVGNHADFVSRSIRNGGITTLQYISILESCTSLYMRGGKIAYVCHTISNSKTENVNVMIENIGKRCARLKTFIDRFIGTIEDFLCNR